LIGRIWNVPLFARHTAMSFLFFQIPGRAACHKPAGLDSLKFEISELSVGFGIAARTVVCYKRIV